MLLRYPAFSVHMNSNLSLSVNVVKSRAQLRQHSSPVYSTQQEKISETMNQGKSPFKVTLPSSGPLVVLWSKVLTSSSLSMEQIFQNFSFTHPHVVVNTQKDTAMSQDEAGQNKSERMQKLLK